MADIVVRIIAGIILFLIGVGVLNGLSKGIIKGKHAGSIGTAFAAMFIWILVFYLIADYLLPIVLIAIPNDLFGYFLMILFVWFVFALIIKLFYDCSFGIGLATGLLLAIILVVLSIVIEIAVIALLVAMGFVLGS